MANCSIPNSTPPTGRTLTTSLRRSRKPSSAAAFFSKAITLAKAIGSWTLRFFNAQRSTLNAQRSIQPVGRWMLGVGRWAFSFSRRVKGAWWSSRSSKPLSVPHTRDRGRFDSYPLRFFAEVPVAVSLCETRASPTGRRLQRLLNERR
jgi:hypothetical protein